MPHENEEENRETPPTSSVLNIAAWWRRFRFSGRVIMCSVLLGLGLILIGGLIFAINVDDDSSKSNSDDVPSQPTKAPSHYTGPVVMGIGGFIVITGVIMCLFETQVCRRRTGDSSPLISDKTEDPEKKDPDPASVPSTSHCHKSHRHGARKTSPSPRKSKSRHVKSKERNGQKSPSPRSPPVPIEPSKSFMTSSEDKFITPPNTLASNATLVKNDNSCESEGKHSGLMKSFTSSDPSWSQSAEFLTPSTSFRDLPATLNNSEAVDKNKDAVNLKATELSEKQHTQPEYMTPLTVEEDRFQHLLIRVKNEQKQQADAKRESSTEISENSGSDSYLSSSEVQGEINKDNEVSIKVENEDNPTQELLSETLPVASASKDANQEQIIQVENAHDVNQNKYETNVPEGSLKVVNNEALNDEISEEAINAAEGRKLSPHDDQKEKISCSSESPSPINENGDHNLATYSDKESSDDKVEEKEKLVDLESSISSDETVVSPDSFQENTINNGPSTEKTTLLNLKGNSTDENKCFNKLESSGNGTTAADNHDVDHLNSQINIPRSDEADVEHQNNQINIPNSDEAADDHQNDQINIPNSDEAAADHQNDQINIPNSDEAVVDHKNNQINIANSDEAGTSDLNLSKTNNVEEIALGMENVSKDGSS